MTHGGSRSSGAPRDRRGLPGLDDEAVDASERALHYFGLGGDSPAYTVSVDWALIKGPRPADEALRTLDGLEAGWPAGSFDLGRAVLLAMLGRIDEAWPWPRRAPTSARGDRAAGRRPAH